MQEALLAHFTGTFLRWLLTSARQLIKSPRSPVQHESRLILRWPANLMKPDETSSARPLQSAHKQHHFRLSNWAQYILRRIRIRRRVTWEKEGGSRSGWGEQQQRLNWRLHLNTKWTNEGMRCRWRGGRRAGGEEGSWLDGGETLGTEQG